MKIDLVYTWVNNNDPRWRADKTFWNKICGNKESSYNCRFCDNEELRYSLRSANINVPWINHIFIITDRQVPYWLDTNHPKITIVDHSEILPREVLPTYHSDAIEMALDNIPELSEHFLYSNDDTFFLNPVSESFFFDHNQNPYVRFCRIEITEEMKKQYAYYYKVCKTFELYNNKFKLPEFFKNFVCYHQIDPYRKSFIKECKKYFENEVYRTMKMKFRSRDSLQRILFSYYMADQKMCVVREVPNVTETLLFNQPEFLNIGMESLNYAIKNDYISNGYPKLLCINDNEKVKEETRKGLKEVLEHFFPIKSEWEID